MLKSLHVGTYDLSPQDFATVVQFFRSIGSDLLIRRRYVMFFAAKGSFAIREAVPGSPENLSRTINIDVSNPDVVRNVAEKMDLRIVDREASSPDAVDFALELPGRITVYVHGDTDTALEATEGKLDASGKRFGVVVSRFNAFITDRLLAGAVDGLNRSGADQRSISIARVPGSFEIPSAARTLAETGKYDAVICLGCLLRGDTAHYDVIVNEVTRGIGQSAQETGVPHAFGVLTCDTLEQAIDRAGLKMGNKGFEAALAAVEMASLKQVVRSQESGVRMKAVSSRPSALSKRRNRSAKKRKR